MTYFRAGAFAAAVELPAGAAVPSDDGDVAVVALVAGDVALAAVVADVGGEGTPVSLRGANCCEPHATSAIEVAIANSVAVRRPRVTDGPAAFPAARPAAAC